MERSDNEDWWPRVLRHPYFWFSAPIVTAIAFPAGLATLTAGSFELAFSLGVVGPIAIILSLLLYRYRSGIRLLASAEADRFFPFCRLDGKVQNTTGLVDHETRVSELRAGLRKNLSIHILIGDSGVGKSTLLRGLAAVEQVASITAGNSFLALCDDIEKCVDKGNLDQIAYLSIDQIERVVSSLRTFDSSSRSRLEAAVAKLRRHRISLIVAVRSDFSAKLIEIFQPHRPNLLFVPGIRFATGGTELAEAKAYIDELDISAEEKAEAHESLSTAPETNSFVFQTTGYLMQCLDHEQRETHLRPFAFKRKIISTYVDLIYKQYSDILQYPDQRIHIETVLYSIAIYNRRHSLPVSADRIAQITSMPTEHIHPCLAYLTDQGIVTVADKGKASYFVAHDLIISDIIDAQPRYMREDYRVAIAELASDLDRARRLPTRTLEVNPFKRWITSQVQAPFTFSLSMVAIWLAVASYGYRLNSDEFGGWILSVVPGWIIDAGGSVDLEDSGYIFPFIFFTLYCWIIFMYGIDRGYFYYLWKDKAISTLSYFHVHIAGSIGIIIGLISSVAPAIFIFGVIIPGCIIALAHADAAWRCGKLDSLFAKYSFRLFWQTLLNMAISLSAWYLIYRVVRENVALDRDMENLIIVCWIALIYTVVAFAMRERQGSETGRWVMLSVYAASKL